MQKLARMLLVFAGVVVCHPSIAAQPPGNTQPMPESADERRSREFLRDLRDRTTPSHPFIKTEPRVIKKGLLAPAPQDRIEHERFLALSDTGLLRLLPGEIYNSRTYKTPVKINVRGGGAYYSFFYKSHEYGYGSDLELSHRKFTVGFAGADYGMLTSLGDVALEDVRKDHPAYQFMASYKPPSQEPDARLEVQKFRTGVIVDGINYQRILPVQANTTYLLRSIVYRTSDVLVAFRVTRIDQDGSVIIAWRKLRTFNTPNLHSK